MSSTPNASFSSDEPNRGRLAQCRSSNLSSLPSPQASDNCSDSDGTHETVAVDAQLDPDNTDDSEIERAYQTVWDIFCGRQHEPQRSNPRFHFQRGQRSYERLYRKLNEHKGLLEYFEGIRKDWNAKVLVLWVMPPRPLHDIFQNSLLLAIEKELDRISGSVPELQPFRKKLCAGGSSAIEKRIRYARSRPLAPIFETSPDGQWFWAGSRYPPFIFEVAYSQEEQSLVDKVTQLFEQLPNGICNILGVDIEYAERTVRRAGHFHTASLSLWTSELLGDQLKVTRIIGHKVFRDASGQAPPGELRLPFSFFVPHQEHNQLPPLSDATDICLTFTQLCELVDNAERQQDVIEATASPSPAPGPPLQRPKRVTFHDEDGTLTRDTEIS